MFLEKVLAAGSFPLVVVGLLLAGIGVPIPEDPLLLVAGVLAHRSPTTEPWWALLPMAYVSVVGADCGLFWMARRMGESILRRRPFKYLVTDKRRATVRHLFDRYGPYAVFAGRHMSGVRAVVFILAGVERMPFSLFLMWDALAALVTVPVVFTLGYLGAAHVAAIETGMAKLEHWLLFGGALALILGWVVWSRRWRQR
ncbi:MAG: DedA family protein [Deltaproteobacteria bacterium]|nr:DedA family protein [Deltaproteobacteria bacterium]